MEGEVERKLHAKLKSSNQPLALLSKEEAESPSALQVDQSTTFQDLDLLDEDKVESDGEVKPSSGDKDGAKVSPTSPIDNRYRQDGSSLSSQPKSDFGSFVNRVEEASLDAFAATSPVAPVVTTKDTPIASNKKSSKKVSDDHVKQSASKSNNLLDSIIEHPKPSVETEDGLDVDTLEVEMNQFDFSEQPPIKGM